MKDDDAPFDPDVESILLNRLDEKPNIIKGCNSDELLICLGIGVGVGLIPSIIFCAIFFQVVYGLIVGIIMFGFLTWQMIKIIGRAKLGRPPGFYKQKVAQWMIKKGFFRLIKGEQPFILYKGRWKADRVFKQKADKKQNSKSRVKQNVSTSKD